MFDGKEFGENIVEIVKGYCEREIAPLKAENAELKSRIAELEARPAPEVVNGEDGKSVDPEDVRLLVAAEVTKAVASMPVPENGKDAAGIVEALKHEGELCLTLQDGRLIKTGIRDGKDGEPGRNGFELEDFDIKRGEDSRTLILCFEGKEQGYEYECSFPFPIYCGIFKEGDRYVPGDLVTWGGCLWHCDKETTEKPGAEGWTLAVKKGRDGKDGKNG